MKIERVQSQIVRLPADEPLADVATTVLQPARAFSAGVSSGQVLPTTEGQQQWRPLT